MICHYAQALYDWIKEDSNEENEEGNLNHAFDNLYFLGVFFNLLTFFVSGSSHRFFRGWSNLEGSHKANTSTSRWWQGTSWLSVHLYVTLSKNSQPHCSEKAFEKELLFHETLSAVTFLSLLSCSYLWRIRRCLMSSWMRISWRTLVNTLQSTWKFTGELRISPVLPLLTPYWTKAWSPHPQLTPANR